ncbi:MAG: sodium:solute symporter [Bacteroidota bacterium]
MLAIDWIVLFSTLAAIIFYGWWNTRNTSGMEGYLLGNKSLPWWNVCLSIMATQASAVTFLSTPGQAYEDGMRFLQFYFGLPLAMIIISTTAVPLFAKLKVYTAYEYLESRFDLKVRALGAVLFLFLRGLSVGITVYAPSLILSTILGWSISLTTVLIGTMVMLYTVSGGTRAVSITQKYQLTIIMAGMIIAGGIAFVRLPQDITFGDTFRLAGEMGKLNLISTEFNLSDRYNIWSGLIGGLFLFLAYFGTDQSQVGRYLGGKDTTESRLGLIFNGLLKIPMQFIILYIGVLVFLFYQFNPAPVFHNQPLYNKARSTIVSGRIDSLEQVNAAVQSGKSAAAVAMAGALKQADPQELADARLTWKKAVDQEKAVRGKAREVISAGIPGARTLDKDYVFINFVMSHLPHGLIGLLLAVVFMAAMSSTASELNALASTSVVDIYRRMVRPGRSEDHYVFASKAFTVFWAMMAMVYASLVDQAENLIQFVNIIGSLFYGTLLGMFLTGFFIPYIRSRAVFIGALVAEGTILYIYTIHRDAVAFLHYNYISCAIVVVVGLLVQVTSGRKAV